MFNPAGHDGVGRFDGLAEVYDRCRPQYAASALAHFLQRCSLRPGMLLIDVGSGTGISSRQMAAAGLRVVGIEPNADMRRVASATAESAGATPVEHRDGRADATGLETACADAVVAAQAFHWFANDIVLTEFHRILKPAGWVVLMWNDLDPADPFTAEYRQALIRLSPLPELAAQIHATHGDILLHCQLFQRSERIAFPNSQELDAEELLGRAFSASFAPTEPEARRKLVDHLQDLHRRFQKNGKTALRYRTTVFTAQRP